MIGLFMVILLGVGIFILTEEYMEDAYREIRKKWIRFIDALKTDEEPKSLKPEDKVWEELRILIKLTLGMGSNMAVKGFVIVSVIMSSGLILALSNKVRPSLVIISSLISGLVPYALLRLKLEGLRIRSSNEGEILITQLLDNYKINYFNMEKAIEVTALTIEEAPNCKKLMFNLSKGMNLAGSGREIRYLLREFQLSINTSWGRILAHNMYFALTSGTEITEALKDLSQSIQRARKIREYSKRENNEARLIFKYLIPITYVLTIIGGIGYFNLSIRQFMTYQFQREVGLTWFIISSIIYVTGLIVNGFLTRTTLDF